MKKNLVDMQRRKVLGATGGGVAATFLGSTLTGWSRRADAMQQKTIRWGFVGTGSIANWMAAVMRGADFSELAAVSSRRMASAKAFADKHQAGRAFDSWEDMIAWDGVDAIYVATPTSVREEICVAAAKNGKHVLGEKPFASLTSLQRITAACRENGVGFMDGTHFVHLPRTHDIRSRMQDSVGWPWSLDSAFQFNLQDRGNIRFNPKLEPLGAVGDAGWYNMRAVVEYLTPRIELRSASTYIRRDEETGAAISGSGVMLFEDGSTSTWNCGFDSGAVNMDLRITGSKGVIRFDDFLTNDSDGTASHTLHTGGFGDSADIETIKSEVSRPGPALMFEDYAAMVLDKDKIEQSMQVSERTQRLLDAVWASGLANENS